MQSSTNVCLGSLNYTYVLEGEDTALWDGGTSRVIRVVIVHPTLRDIPGKQSCMRQSNDGVFVLS